MSSGVLDALQPLAFMSLFCSERVIEDMIVSLVSCGGIWTQMDVTVSQRSFFCRVLPPTQRSDAYCVQSARRSGCGNEV